MKTKRKRMDLPPEAVEIYSRILSIEAVKGEDSNFPGEYFRHDFEKGARVFGLPNGSILIKSTDGKRLWETFDSDIGEEED